jgi:hypothetical protein
MEMLLIRERLWSIVCKRRERPAAAAARNQWDDDAERATATIFLYLDERAERHVQNLRDPIELWEKLENVYERKGFSARFYLWQKLFTLRLADYRDRSDGNAMDLYLDTYRTYCQQLRSSGAEISNEIEASVLLNGLDENYENFIVATTQTFRQADDAEIDVERLISQLYDENRRRAANQTEIGNPDIDTSGRALLAHGKKRPHSNSNLNDPRPICFHCNKIGHIKDNCWELHPEKYHDSKRWKPSKGSGLIATAITTMPCPDCKAV